MLLKNIRYSLKKKVLKADKFGFQNKISYTVNSLIKSFRNGYRYEETIKIDNGVAYIKKLQKDLKTPNRLDKFQRLEQF